MKFAISETFWFFWAGAYCWKLAKFFAEHIQEEALTLIMQKVFDIKKMQKLYKRALFIHLIRLWIR